jgi:type VI secretion system ImpA family protein
LSRSLWPVLWPRPDDDDLEPRLAPFFWIDTRLTAELMRLPVTEGGGDVGVLNYQQYLRGKQLQRVAANKPGAFEEAIADGDVPFEKVQSELGRCHDDFILENWQGSRLALEALARLTEVLDGVLKEEGPSFTTFRQALTDIDGLFGREAAARKLVEPEREAKPKKTDEAKGAGMKPATKRPSVPAGDVQITDRRTAYALLDQVADWLLDNDPHSPSPYLIKRAVAWEKSSLGEVLDDLLTTGGSIETAMRVLGLDRDGLKGRGNDDDSFADDM